MRNIAIIPARSGSKGLKDKNIKILNGKPLLAYSAEAARDAGIFDEIMVSTDSEKYAEIGREYGANVPFLRTKELSGDNAGSWDVVKQVLSQYRLNGECFDTICLLQPTSPLRTTQDILDAYDFMEEKHAEAVTSVCEVDHSPLWTMVLPENQSLKEYNENSKNDVPRQQLATYYRFNGAIYIRKIKYHEDTIELLEENEYAFIMEQNKSVDIDTELDFIIAEKVMDYYG